LIVYEEVEAHGHPNIQAKHRTTIEITKDEEVTLRGDCIIGVKANKSVYDLSDSFKNSLKTDYSILVIVLETNNYREIILAQGSCNLVLGDNRRIIIRKSNYIEPATIGIKANKAAHDLDRKLVKELKDPGTILKIKLYVINSLELDKLVEFYT